MGDADSAPGSWLPPGPISATAGIWGGKLQLVDLCLSAILFPSYINKPKLISKSKDCTGANFPFVILANLLSDVGPVPSSQMATSSCELKGWERQGVFLGSLSRTLIPFPRDPTPQTPPLNTGTWGIRIKTNGGTGNTHIQSTAMMSINEISTCPWQGLC